MNGLTEFINVPIFQSQMCTDINSYVSIVLCKNLFGQCPVAEPASVAQWAETQCAPTRTICRRSRGSIPGRPVDFMFGFQGRML